MENSTQENNSQIDYLKDRLNLFLEVIDSLDPESTELDDIDRLIQMLDDLELQFKKE